jgi:2-oxoisovalerate dehydrogenase E1 component
MPKALTVDPKVVRQPGVLKTKDIPLNQYKGDIQVELKKYGKDKLVRIFHPMATSREC